MNKLVEDGIQCVHEGEHSRAASLFQQALAQNPQDTDALLGMAYVSIDTDQKRKFFQRLLDINPKNHIARHALLEIDRQYIQNPNRLPHVDFLLIGKPIIFQFSPLLHIGLFLLSFMNMILLWASFVGYAPIYMRILFLSIAILLIYLIIATLHKVEVDDRGIRIVGFLKNQSINWENITNIKGGQAGIVLMDKNKIVSVKVIFLITGYPDIIRLLRLKCPELWKPRSEQIFRKGILPMILVFLIGSPFMIGGVSYVISGGNNLGTIAILIGWSLFFLAIGLGQLGSAKLEGDTLIIRNNIEYRRLTAHQITHIDLERIVGVQLHGVSMHQYIVIETTEGKVLKTGGYKDGDEVVYNILFRWWDEHKNNNRGV
jgi:tetratricopeptide (TPR) repeat protein